MDHDIDSYLQVVFAAVRDCTPSFRSETSNFVDTLSAVLCQGVSSILTHLDSHLTASASDPPVTASSDPMGSVAALPPS